MLDDEVNMFLGGLYLVHEIGLSYYQLIKRYIVQAITIVVPLVFVVVMHRFLYVQWHTSIVVAYIECVVGICVITAAIYYKKLLCSYGLMIAGFYTLYVAYYALYNDFYALGAEHVLVGLVGLYILGLLAAFIFKGRLCAFMIVIASLAMPFLFNTIMLTKQLLISYCLFILATAMILSYVIDFFSLNLVSFSGYILYNQYFIEPKIETFELEELLYITGALFIIYAVLPIFTALFSHKDRQAESISIMLISAYAFITVQSFFATQLQRINELPFFVKIWLRGVPSMTNINLQILAVYTIVYAAMILLLLLINRKAKKSLTTLTNLFMVSAIGFLYLYNISGFLHIITEWIKEHSINLKELITGCGGWI